MNERLMEALLAMDRLNSFARSPGCAPRKAIYWLKSRYAIRDAIMAGLATRMRAIQVTTTCSRCDKGIYRDWCGDHRGPCYHCGGTARKTLKFIETTIDLQERERVIHDVNGNEAMKVTFPEPAKKQVVWHSPVEYSSWLGWPTDDLQFEEAQDWTVGTQGKPLTTVELAEAMNIVETYWPWWRKHSPYESSREEYDSHRYFIFNYALDIGTGSKSCELCGGEHKGFYHFTVAPGITRGASTCTACQADPEVWKKLTALPMPQLHPEIQKWRTRHTIDFEKTWERGWNEKVEWQDRKMDGEAVGAN